MFAPTGSYPTKILGEHRLEPGNRLTLITLYATADPDTMISWASAQELAELSGYSLRSIHHHLQRIRETGWAVARQIADEKNGGYYYGTELRFDVSGEERKIDG